ncbi:MAG: Rne/Rng family ribonuclease, partial [Alphaproteobacteria bacterium]|nr:Rne/Rng family ribonuclease [Alphaproteobacteria bacterium]
MSTELLIEVAAGEVRAAVLREGAVVDLVIERRGRPSLVGNIYLGRVQRVLPGMNAAFVEAGIGRAGFLDIDGARPAGRASEGAARIGDLVAEGDAVLVQVVRDPVGRKGVEFTCSIALPGRLLVLTPGEPRLVVSRQIEEAEAGRLAALAQPFADDQGGFIVRTAAAGVEAQALAAEAGA